MRKVFTPSKDAAHRLACLSLYRALVKQCTEFTGSAARSSGLVNNVPSSTLKSLVRYRFDRDKKLKTWQQIRDALKLGRTALELFQDAASGSPGALDAMTRVISASMAVAIRERDMLKHIHDERDQTQLPKKFVLRKTRESFKANKSNYQRQASTVPVLDRPVPYQQALKHKDGRRKVPHYFVAQGIPFLRYTRRQPLSLSRYLKEQITKHEKYWENSISFQERVQMADLEDSWDAQLRRDHKLQQRDPTYSQAEDGWSETYDAALKDNETRIARLDKKKLEYGEKLWDVFLREENLAKIENHARKTMNERKSMAKREQNSETIN